MLPSSASSNRRTSPYFLKRKKSTPILSRESSSPFFRRRHVCPEASANSLGPLMICLSTSNGTMTSLSRCSRVVDSSRKDNCESCAARIAESRSHFQSCATFEYRWQEYVAMKLEKGSIKQAPCWIEAEQRLHYAVRHLCHGNCYMRAYAPYRAWHEVCSSTSPLSSDDDDALACLTHGWACKLVSPRMRKDKSCHDKKTKTQMDARVRRRQTPCNESHLLPRIYFTSDQGQHFPSETSVIQNIREHRRHKGIRIDLFDRNKTLLSVHSEGDDRKNLCITKKIPSVDSFLNHPVESPYGLLEELFYDDPWKLILSAILLNRTTRKQVDPVMFEFIKQWPCPEAVVAEEDISRMEYVLRPLGMYHRRTVGIRKFSEQFIDVSKERSIHGLERKHILSFRNCGEYAYSAYQLFIQHNWTIDPSDSMLKVYVDYQRALLRKK